MVDWCDASQVGRQVAVRAVRRQGRVRAARRREVLPRLLGQEDRRRRNRRARVRAQALHPRALRREIPHLPFHAEAPLRSADRRRRWVRFVPHANALSELRLGRAGLPSRRRSGRTAFLGDSRRRRRGRGHRAVGRRQMAHGNIPVGKPRTGGLERRDVSYNLSFSLQLVHIPREEPMNRARVVFAATAVCAAFVGSTVIAQQSTPQAPPMQSILAGKKFIPPVKGQAEIEYVKSPTRREGSTLITKITVKNTMNAPIPRLKVAETWYDKQQNMLPGGEAVVNGLLQPGEVQTLEVRTPTNPNFQVQMFMLTHDNGGVKPHLVKSLDESKKEPAAKNASATKPAPAKAAKKK